MESVLGREFDIHGETLRNAVYWQKIRKINVPKLAEFNFKLLHNIVPCGKVIHKWQNYVSENCEFCGKIETTKHMLFDCPRVIDIWKMINNHINLMVTWKHILCGFPSYDITQKLCDLNYVIVIVAYAIFKENNRCKWEKISYKDTNLVATVKENLRCYSIICKQLDHKSTDILLNACKSL